MGRTKDWSSPEGAWELRLTNIGRKWVWELYYYPDDGPPTQLVDYGSCRTRQRAINRAAVARIHYTKKHIWKKQENIKL